MGSSDVTDVVVTDVIVNTAGGLVGLGLLAVMRHPRQDRTRTVLTRVASIGTAVALLAAVLFVASPMHYAPLRDIRNPVVSGVSETSG
ncbi:hypothetical protein [Agromyces italicus]|uniref:hypothetical protein n=1 Tax=Agromyces italicus TaxID=279572 RepID=UPI0003B339B9|nr:hypothetical protein [Agromyces italicus]